MKNNYKNKTKKEIITELEELTVKHESLKKEFSHWTHELRERSKELNCLYNIFYIIDKEYSVEKIIQKVISIIPSSWQYPEVTSVRVVWEGNEFKSVNFREGIHAQSVNIVVYGEKKGTIDVFYLEERPAADEGPFLSSERYLINGIALTLGKIIELKKAESELGNSHRKLHELFERLEIIREEERKNIAQEIYDEVGKLLSILKLDIMNLSKNLSEEDKMLVKKINSMTTLIDMTIQNIKKVASELSPLLVHEFGLPVALIWYVKEFESRMGIKCKVTFNPEDIILDKDQSILIYELIQELLTNIVFHTMATKINIGLEKIDNNFVISLSDNGVEIKTTKYQNGDYLTLWGIKERIDYLGGRCLISNNISQGNNINIYLPLTFRKNSSIRVFIADDHPLIRKGLKQIVEETGDIIVADEASDGKTMVNKIINENNYYDAVLLNISMPDMNGLEIIKILKSARPEIPVLVFGNYSEKLYAIRVLQIGAYGYLSKERLMDELVIAIRLIIHGKKYIPPSIANLLAINLEKNINNKLPHELLSEREFEIMSMLSSNMKLKYIAEKLSLSIKTVSSHKANILKKMNMKNNSEIVKYVMETGINIKPLDV